MNRYFIHFDFAIMSLKKFVETYSPKTYHDVYIYSYTILTIVMVLCYIFIHFKIKTEYGEHYLPLIRTVRTIILSIFLIYFYNPFRSTFEYGRALPIFAGAAGVALLLTLTKYDVLNLVHFCLYGQLLPPIKKNGCILENDPEVSVKALQKNKTI